MTPSPTEADDIEQRLLPRGVVVLLSGAGAVVLLGGMRAASDFVAPIFFALVLTIACAPVRQVALRHRLPSWAATLAMLVTAYAIVLVLVLSLAVSVVQLAATVPQYSDQANELVADAQKWLTGQWTFVLGSLGALLAVPMTLLARAVLVDADPSAGWARAFIGSTPQPKDDPPAPEPDEPELEHSTAD